jgi:hypothetical protein
MKKALLIILHVTLIMNVSATLSNNIGEFQQLIHPIYAFLQSTPTRVPLSDWHETTNGKQVGFQARSVVGGYFIKMLDDKWNKK